MKELIDAVSVHFIECELSNALDAKTLWISSTENNSSATEFAYQYSYLVSNTEAFSNVTLDDQNAIKAKIERYGGIPGTHSKLTCPFIPLYSLYQLPSAFLRISILDNQ